ncbi:MAG: 50S ribosomal protein L3 [Ignavibacteria bacterium RBG_13_36_8]|nr:MAG: 50S ribosomal protein L3 [Ignavibacteria bacterium RBG_13_36_8]
MPGLIGKKLGMTTIFSEDGRAVPVTVIEAGPCEIVSIKIKEKEKYEALQLGFGSKKGKHLKKPQAEYFKKVNVAPPAVLKEFKNFSITDYKVGDKLTVEIFQVGDKVKVTSKTKGKGFQGVMKRHGFGGVGGTTHGQSDRLRAPGSIGASSYPSRVFKGQKMAGRTGYSQLTVRNLKVAKILPEKNIVMVKGAVPGAINSIVEINK